jgi:hypothetical protein
MKERFAKLIDVKSFISLFLTAVFCYLSIIGRINADLFMTVYTTVIAFFFGVQYSKAQAAKKE